MKQKGWKITAIIFIILFVLETLFLIWAWNLANKSITGENECGYNVCKDYDSYQFYNSMCYCYLDNELAYQEYIK
jgi:hypothetical protein